MRHFYGLPSFSIFCHLLISSWVLSTSLAHASDNNLEKTTSASESRISGYRFNRAEILKKSMPRYPRKELDKGIEGWAVYSVVVDENGKVTQPILIDSSGNKGFEIAAKRSVKKMLYKPATLNGNAIESSDNKLMVGFSIAASKVGAHKGFLRRYRDIRKKIMSNELEGVSEEIKRLEEQYTRNRYEMAWLHLLKSSYYYQIKDHAKYLSALKRAVSYESKNLPEDIYASSLVNLYNAQVQDQQIADALATAEKIEKLSQKMPKLNKIIQHRDDLILKLAEHSLLVTQATIDKDEEPWRHQLYRNTIGVELKKGKLSQVEFRCANKIRRFEINEDNQSWKIPKKWEDCTAFISGEKGSQFELLEQA